MTSGIDGDLAERPADAGSDTDGDGAELPPTIYDVARAAGVSIASVSRVLNGTRNPREETRDRVLQAVAELGFVPDGAARALSVRLKEVVGVVVRRPAAVAPAGHVRGRGREPPVPGHDQPGHGAGGPALQLRPADPVGGPARAGRPADLRAGPQERRADPARLGAGGRAADPAGAAGAGGDHRLRPDADDGERAQRQRGRDRRAGPAPDRRPRLPLARLPGRAPGQPGQRDQGRRRWCG